MNARDLPTSLSLRVGLVLFSLTFISIITSANIGHGDWIWSLAGVVPWGDKWGHLLLVGIFSWLLNASLKGRRAPGKFHFMMIGSFLLVIGMSLEEASQYLNPYRDCDLLDGLANIGGVACGELLVRSGGKFP